jgi:hypothetical protein
MIRFLAHVWVKDAATFQKFIDNPPLPHSKEKLDELFSRVCEIRQHCQLLGLTLSYNKASETANALAVGHCSPEMLRSLLHELRNRMIEELESEWFKYIPRYKVQYIQPGRFNVPELAAFGWDTQIEFARAGECFALGLNTATVFHLMRIVDAGLKSAAKSLGITYHSESWQTIGHKINDKMQEKYHLKTDEWKKTEPFYAELLTDIGAIGKAHRNPTLHDLKVNYSEEDTQYLFIVTEAFIGHLAKGGLREA